MTVHAVLVDPPREGLVLRDLVETSPLTAAEAADLYAAMVRDTIGAVAASGGDLLVNYRSDEQLDPAYRTDTTAEDELRALANQTLDDPSQARFEVQVGSTFAARAGNTATHLLREEEATSVAVLDATAPTLGRTHLDTAAMKLRSSGMVLGPALRGDVYYLGLGDVIDFEGAYAPPELQTLTDRGVDAGYDVDFLSMEPHVRTGADLRSLLPVLRARRAAGRLVPANTMDVLDRLGLEVTEDDGEPRLSRHPRTDSS